MSKIKELPLIIYQNTYFTDSLISIIQDGFIGSEKQKIINDIKKDISAEIKAESKSFMGIIPFAGYGQAKGGINSADSWSIEKDVKITDSYRFNKIKEYLGNDLTQIDIKTDFNKLELGQFVEFTSNYKKNEIRELVDILLNEDVLDMIFALPQINVRNKFFTSFIEEGELNGTYDPKTIGTENVQIKSWNGKFVRKIDGEHKTEFLKKIYKIIERLKKDFPDDATTLDFYGQVKDTNIRNFLICDTKFFVQEDKNRILDGKFRVFGKVIDIQDDITIESGNSIEKAFSQLDRNQFFKRATDESIQKLQSFIENLISSLKDQKDSDGEKWFNSKIDLITKGKAIKVLPIVIYT